MFISQLKLLINNFSIFAVDYGGFKHDYYTEQGIPV